MATHEAILLPTEVNPTNYQICLTPEFDHFTFSGYEDIDLSMLKPARQITLHGVGLTVLTSYLSFGGDTDNDISPVSVESNEQAETVTFIFDREIPAGNTILHIGYQGILSDNLSGFYRSKVDMPDGTTRWMATTQFEATDARKAFFCIDEPARKATFEICLVSPHDFTAISNMPVAEKTPSRTGFYDIYRFEKTPVMSTYLLAFIIGPMEAVETTSRDGVLVRVYTPPGKKEQGLFALDAANRILPFYNDYFGIPYPLPKLDLIAIPDFAAGAMENWGAITYRETALLIGPDSSPAMKQGVAIVVAHEIAHQWFGNLVTMAWWNDLWLNEGFASWIEYLAVDHLFPEWEIWTQFVAGDFAGALDADGLKNSHPIEQEVGHPDEISELFDAVSYSKGSVVIRMLENYLGKDVFAAGLHHYLTLHAYGNAKTVDLWLALEEVSGKPVTRLMSGWTRETGYPMVKVWETEQGLALQQSRFLANGEKLLEKEKQLWHVPLLISFNGEDEITFNLVDEIEPLSIGFSSDTCMKLNAGQTTLCRVNYTPEQWRLLKDAVVTTALPPMDRLGLQNDAFALARAGYMPITQALELAEGYRYETDYAVWADICGNLMACGSIWSQESFYHKHYRRFVRELVRPTVNRLGWDAESTRERHLVALLRSMMISVAGYHGILSVMAEARSRFDCYLQDPEALDPNLRAAVYRMVVANGGKRCYDEMIDLYRLGATSEEKNRCLRALGSAKDQHLLRHALEFAFSSEVRSQDAMYVIAGVAGNPMGRDIAWKFLQEHWQELKDRYHGGAISLFSRIIGMVTSQFTDEAHACEIEEFFRSHDASGAERTIRQSLERVRWNARFLASSREEAGQWLERRR